MYDQPLSPSENEALTAAIGELDAGKYTFIDAGASRGGSLEFCEKRMRSGPGIGFDVDPNKVKEAREAGHRVVRANLCETVFPPNCVSFAALFDFLEHLPGIEEARLVLKRLALAATDFLVIRHPSFEESDYLKQHGFKLAWSHWSGHPNAMLLSELEEIFDGFGWDDYLVTPRHPITDSAHDAIVPIDAPINTIRYDAEKHGEKLLVTFDRPLFCRYEIFVKLNPNLTRRQWQRILKRLGQRAPRRSRFAACSS